jgi:predicted O-methyltransferase YrrM
MDLPFISWLSHSRKIPGWLTDREAEQLYTLAAEASRSEMPLAVELGAWQGKSSVMIGGGLSRNPDARLICVDPFESDENPEYQRKYYDPLLAEMDRTQHQAFLDHIQRCGLSGMAHSICAYSFDAVRTWTEAIDLLFIDANHDYECVNRDFEQWIPFLKIGGVVVLHDVSTAWPGPTQVRDEKLKPPNFGPPSQVDSLAWATRIR